MARNPIQFQSGLSLPAFLEQFGTEAQCQAALFQHRCPGSSASATTPPGSSSTSGCRSCTNATRKRGSPDASSWMLPTWMGNGRESAGVALSTSFRSCRRADR